MAALGAACGSSSPSFSLHLRSPHPLCQDMCWARQRIWSEDPNGPLRGWKSWSPCPQAKAVARCLVTIRTGWENTKGTPSETTIVQIQSSIATMEGRLSWSAGSPRPARCVLSSQVRLWRPPGRSILSPGTRASHPTELGFF